MPQGPGTYGTQQGRPRKDKKKKVVDPKKQQPAQGAPQAPAPARTDMKGRPVIEDGTKKEAAIEAEVNQRMTPGGIDTRNQQLEQEGFLKPGDADRMRRTSREYDATFNRPQESARTQSMDAGNQMMSNYRQNQQAKEANRMQTPGQQQENAARREERKAVRETEQAQRDSEKLAEFEASGFEGTQEEYFEDKFNASPAGIAREERRVKRVAKEEQEQIDGKARKKARQERFREKRDRRSDMNTRYMEAKRMGLTPGTPEFIEFAGGGRGQQDAREQELEMARITSGEGVAKITTQGQITIEDMRNSTNVTITKMDNASQEALAKYAGENNIALATLNNMSAEEIANIQAEMAKSVATTEGQTAENVATTQGQTAENVATTQAGAATTVAKTTTEGQVTMNKAQLAAAETIAARGDVTANKQMDIMKGLEEGKIDLAAFQVELDAMLNLENATADRMAQFLTALGSTGAVTPEMMELGLARLAQMDGGAEFVDQVKGFKSDVSLSGLSDDEIAKRKADQEEKREIVKRTVSQPGRPDVVFKTQEEHDAWMGMASTAMGTTSGTGTASDGWMARMKDVPNILGVMKEVDIEEYKGHVSEMQNMIYELQTMDDVEQAKNLAKNLLPSISDYNSFDFGGGSTGGHLENAADGFLETVLRISRGNMDSSANWRSAVIELGMEDIMPEKQ